MQDVVSLFVTLSFFVCFLLLLLVIFLCVFFLFFLSALVVPFPKSCHISCDRLGVCLFGGDSEQQWWW